MGSILGEYHGRHDSNSKDWAQDRGTGQGHRTGVQDRGTGQGHRGQDKGRTKAQDKGTGQGTGQGHRTRGTREGWATGEERVLDVDFVCAPTSVHEPGQRVEPRQDQQGLQQLGQRPGFAVALGLGQACHVVAGEAPRAMGENGADVMELAELRGKIVGALQPLDVGTSKGIEGKEGGGRREEGRVGLAGGRRGGKWDCSQADRRHTR